MAALSYSLGITMTQPQGNQSEPADRLGLDSLLGPSDQGLSLESLSAAFTEMLATGDDPYAAPVAEPLTQENGAAVEPVEGPPDAIELCPRTIVEAMLFVGLPDGQPLTPVQIAATMRGVRAAEIDQLVIELNGQYAEQNCPYVIASTGAGYQMLLREPFQRLATQFHGRTRQVKLSQAAIEVLSLVAYHEPISSEKVSQLRGRPSQAIMAQLVRRQLLRLERTKGEPTQYFTTPRFLNLFGLESLADLPQPQDP